MPIISLRSMTVGLPTSVPLALLRFASPGIGRAPDLFSVPWFGSRLEICCVSFDSRGLHGSHVYLLLQPVLNCDQLSNSTTSLAAQQIPTGSPMDRSK